MRSPHIDKNCLLPDCHEKKIVCEKYGKNQLSEATPHVSNACSLVLRIKCLIKGAWAFLVYSAV